MPKTEKNTLQQATLEVRPTQFLDYRKYLQELYSWLKLNLTTYSYLQFAEDLGFSQTNMVHLAIRGKRHLRLSSLYKICEALELKGLERQYLELLFKYTTARLPRDREAHFQRLLQLKNRTLTSQMDLYQLEYYSEWYHPVIREMVSMPDFDPDPAWIAQRITPRVLPEQARKSLELLQNLGLIRFSEEQKRFVISNRSISTGDEVANMAVTRYHQRTIEIGREAVTGVPAQRRDISALTMCVSKETAQRIKQEIQKFRKQILAIADSSENPDEIVQMNIQLFPFIK
jgi:uncharacterized protein (TIGR02147 family)